MSKSRRSKAPGKINVYCPTGHDTGVPVAGFVAMPEPGATVTRIDVVGTSTQQIAESIIGRVLYPPTPPPKQPLL